MKQMKRTGIYQSSNYKVTFDPNKVHAVSYSWWVFVTVIEGLVVFNNYRYSVTTAKHQSKVRNLMSELGIKINLEISCQKSLGIISNLSDLEENVLNQINNDEYEANEKRIARNARAKARRDQRKALDLNNETVVDFAQEGAR